MDDDLYEGEHDLVDEDKLEKCVSDLDQAYSRADFFYSCMKERDTMNCVQSRLGLEGHQLPVTTMSWREDPKNNGSAQILAGSQDQVSRCFVFLICESDMRMCLYLTVLPPRLPPFSRSRNPS